MSESDPLDGFRDKSPAEVEAELRRKLGDSEFLVDLLHMGDQMRAWIETPPGALLYATLRDQVNEALAKLLLAPTLSTEAAIAAHAEGRAAYRALELINQTLRAGEEAERTLNAQESTPT